MRTCTSTGDDSAAKSSAAVLQDLDETARLVTCLPPVSQAVY